MPRRTLAENETPRRAHITDAARTAREKALAGKSPRERANEKLLAVLLWLSRWGWSSSTILGAVADTRRGTELVKRMHRDGLVRRTQIKIVSVYRTVPADIVTLTPAGVAQLVALDGEIADARCCMPPRVNKAQAVHDLMVQKLTLVYLGRWPGLAPDDAFADRHGHVVGFSAEGVHSEKLVVGRKVPDVVFSTDQHQRIAVELELTPKFGGELERFICAHVAAQYGKMNGENAYDALMVFFVSAATCARYQTAMAPGTIVRKWFWSTSGQPYEWRPEPEENWIHVPVDGEDMEDFTTVCEVLPKDF